MDARTSAMINLLEHSYLRADNLLCLLEIQTKLTVRLHRLQVQFATGDSVSLDQDLADKRTQRHYKRVKVFQIYERVSVSPSSVAYLALTAERDEPRN